MSILRIKNSKGEWIDIPAIKGADGKDGEVTLEQLKSITGELENLSTEDKSNLVNAINEVLSNAGSGQASIQTLSGSITMSELQSYTVSGGTTPFYTTSALTITGISSITSFVIPTKTLFFVRNNNGNLSYSGEIWYQTYTGAYKYVNINGGIVTSGTGGYTTNGTNQTITGKKTFDVLPESSVTPTADNQLVNKAYVTTAMSNINIAKSFTTEKSFSDNTASGMYRNTAIYARAVHIENKYGTKLVTSYCPPGSYCLWCKETSTLYMYSYRETSSGDTNYSIQILRGPWNGTVGSKTTLVDKTYVDTTIASAGSSIPELSGSISFSDFDLEPEKTTAYFAKEDVTITGITTIKTFTFPKGCIFYIRRYGTSPITESGGGWYWKLNSDIHGFGVAGGTGSEHKKTFLSYASTPTIKNQWTFNVIPKTEVVPTVDAHLVNKKYVDDKVASSGGGSSVNYSTEEQVIGTYLGKTLYGKVVVGTLDGSWSEDGITFSWIDLGVKVDKVPRLNVSFTRNEEFIYTEASNKDMVVSLRNGRGEITTTELQVGLTTSMFASQEIDIIIEYTKATE